MRHKTIVWAGEYMDIEINNGEVQVYRKDGTRVNEIIEREIINLFRLRA